MHPANELRGQSSDRLYGKKIVLGITGSIAAVENVKLVHELIRHGAVVYPVMTSAVCKIIDPEALKFASGHTPITELTGDAEHVKLCGQVKDKADLLLIAPCSANTISKIAHGIDDTTVTTFATTAIGSKIPIIIVPAMHGSMYEHPIIQENIKKLKDNKKLNITFIEPVKAENKCKMPVIDDIVARIIRKLWLCDLDGKRVLVIGGATAEPIDDMRIITSLSTGETSIALAKQAFLRGADTVLWLGNANAELPGYIYTERFQSVNDLLRKVSTLKCMGKNAFQIIIVCAAISDYTVRSKYHGKIPSGKKKMNIELHPTPKIIKIIRKKAKNSFLVGYKAESKLEQKKLIAKAKERQKEWKLDMIIANDLAKVTRKKNEIFIIQPGKKYIELNGEKEYLGERIFDEIVNK